MHLREFKFLFILIRVCILFVVEKTLLFHLICGHFVLLLLLCAIYKAFVDDLSSFLAAVCEICDAISISYFCLCNSAIISESGSPVSVVSCAKMNCSLVKQPGGILLMFSW